VNVTKLANELEYIVTSNYRDLYLKVDTTLLQAAKMLRQQQAEIEKSKEKNKELYKFKELYARSIPKQEWEK